MRRRQREALAAPLRLEVAVARERAVAAVGEEGVAAEVALVLPAEEVEEHRLVVPEQEHAVVSLAERRAAARPRRWHRARGRRSRRGRRAGRRPRARAASSSSLEQPELAVDVTDRVEHRRLVGHAAGAAAAQRAPRAARSRAMSAPRLAAQRAPAPAPPPGSGPPPPAPAGGRARRGAGSSGSRSPSRESPRSSFTSRSASSGASFTPSISVYSKNTGRRRDSSGRPAQRPEQLAQREAPVQRHQLVAHRVGRGVQRDREVHRRGAQQLGDLRHHARGRDGDPSRREAEAPSGRSAGASPRAPPAGSAAARPSP